MVNDRSLVGGAGAEIHLSRLADALRAGGHEVRLFAGDVIHQGAARLLDVWDPEARRSLREIAAAFRPDVVHFHNVTRELSGSVLGAVPQAACVLTIHDQRILGVPDGSAGAPTDPQPLRAVKMAKARLERRLAIRHMDAVIAMTGAIAEACRRVGFRSVHRVPNLAPPGSEPEAPPSSSSVVLFAGRLAAAKGCDVLIDAFVRVADHHPDATLLFAGDGPDRSELEARAEKRLPGRVRFLGTLSEDETRALMNRVRLLALPSLADVAPNVVIEAAFAARPIVISAIPGIHELVDEAGCGVVVPPGDVGALARALDELLSGAERSDRMGRAGRTAALETRTPEVVAAATMEVYQAAIIRAGARRPVASRPYPHARDRRTS